MPEAMEVGVTQATLSGGDPLTHPEIIEIIRGIAELGLRVKVDTVGTALLGDAPIKFFGKGIARKVDICALTPYIHTLGLPIDGSTEESRNNFRVGRAELVSEVLQTVQAAKKVGLRVSINTVAHRRNIGELGNIMKLVASSGADEWQIFEFQPTGPLGSRSAPVLELEPGEFDKAASVVAKCSNGSSGLRIVCKGRSVRKDAYFMVDDAGVSWTPSAAGDTRTVIGHITRNRIEVLARLREHVQARTVDVS
jgi:MoaA/NifB/PqqE/SkfB family radical SAM enzyme